MGGGDWEGVARRWEEIVFVQLGLMVRFGRKGSRLIEEDMMVIERREMPLVSNEICCEER